MLVLFLIASFLVSPARAWQYNDECGGGELRKISASYLECEDTAVRTWYKTWGDKPGKARIRTDCNLKVFIGSEAANNSHEFDISTGDNLMIVCEGDMKSIKFDVNGIVY